MNELLGWFRGLLFNGRRGGLMVSALDSGASGPGSSPGRGHCLASRTYVRMYVRPGKVEILLAASCYRNRDKLRQL